MITPFRQSGAIDCLLFKQVSIEDPTAAELLTAANAAILSLITGKAKSISIAGRSFEYNDLDALRQMRRELTRECREPNTTIRLGDVS